MEKKAWLLYITDQGRKGIVSINSTVADDFRGLVPRNTIKTYYPFYSKAEATKFERTLNDETINS